MMSYTIRPPDSKGWLPRPLRNALISGGVLLFVIVFCGVGYTWYADQHTVMQPADTTLSQASSPAFAKPVQTAANAREGVAVETISTPVAPGDHASITIRTNPASSCKITVVYKDQPSTDSGLTTKTADEYGTVTWSWAVGKAVPLGTWPVDVTCTYNGRSGFVRGDLQVAK